MVHLDGHWALGVAEFGESCAERFSIMTVVEESAKFCFGNRGNNFLEAMCGDQDRTIVGRWGVTSLGGGVHISVGCVLRKKKLALCSLR